MQLSNVRIIIHLSFFTNFISGKNSYKLFPTDELGSFYILTNISLGMFVKIGKFERNIINDYGLGTGLVG